MGVLRNAGISAGDIFLFFGLFRETEFDREGKLKYVRGSKPVQVIYGYLQIGEILTEPEQIREYSWHPHSVCENYQRGRNALFIPAEKLSICPDLKGYGVLSYRNDRVLTMDGKTAGTWKDYEFLQPDHIEGHRKNCAKGEGIYYQGQWQELIVCDDAGAQEWVKQIVR